MVLRNFLLDQACGSKVIISSKLSGVSSLLMSNIFNMKLCFIFQRIFQYLMRFSWVFFFNFLLAGLCTRSYWWISIHWNIPVYLGWSLLEHGEWPFDMLLGSKCEDFVEYFFINIHKKKWPEVLFLCLLRSVLANMYLVTVGCVCLSWKMGLCLRSCWSLGG